MKRTVQQMEAGCEHRICKAINRMIQARSATEKLQALHWVKAWEARRFRNLSQEVAMSAQPAGYASALQLAKHQDLGTVAALQFPRYQATAVMQH